MMGDAGNAMLSEGAGEDAEEVFDNGVGDMESYGTKTLDSSNTLLALPRRCLRPLSVPRFLHSVASDRKSWSSTDPGESAPSGELPREGRWFNAESDATGTAIGTLFLARRCLRCSAATSLHASTLGAM